MVPTPVPMGITWMVLFPDPSFDPVNLCKSQWAPTHWLHAHVTAVLQIISRGAAMMSWGMLGAWPHIYEEGSIWHVPVVLYQWSLGSCFHRRMAIMSSNVNGQWWFSCFWDDDFVYVGGSNRILSVYLLYLFGHSCVCYDVLFCIFFIKKIAVVTTYFHTRPIVWHTWHMWRQGPVCDLIKVERPFRNISKIPNRSKP
jgi:hypothetical protein